MNGGIEPLALLKGHHRFPSGLGSQPRRSPILAEGGCTRSPNPCWEVPAAFKAVPARLSGSPSVFSARNDGYLSIQSSKQGLSVARCRLGIEPKLRNLLSRVLPLHHIRSISGQYHCTTINSNIQGPKWRSRPRFKMLVTLFWRNERDLNPRGTLPPLQV